MKTKGEMYDDCVLTEDPSQIKQLILVSNKILYSQQIYLDISSQSHVPWAIIAAIHFRETSLRFERHLHNGDPLTARTVNVPKGRPIKGNIPFTFVDSAIDALHNVWKPKTWTVEESLEFLERYNGLGYRKRGLHSPYLWNFTHYYTSGLFIKDGIFKADVIESRPGCVAILKALQLEGVDLGISQDSVDHNHSPDHLPSS